MKPHIAVIKNRKDLFNLKYNNKNFVKYDLYKLTPIEIYKLVRSGRLNKFPNNFWEFPQSDIYAPEIIRYMVENILCWNDENIKKKLRKDTFRENKIGKMLASKYHNSPFLAITNAYPEKSFHAWDFVNAPNGYWQGEKGKENAIAATKWLIEEHLKWSHKDIIEKLNRQVFKDNNLLGMLKKAFNNSMYNAIQTTYPCKFKEWEIGGHVENGTWNKSKGILAVKWLIEDKLIWSDEDIKEKYTNHIYIDNNLNGMLQRCFNSSPYKALNSAYPNKFKPWELPTVPRNFWDSKENCIAALKWLLDEKLNMDASLAKKELKLNMLYDYKLIGIYNKYTIGELMELL